jgi:hypothetical protein
VPSAEEIPRWVGEIDRWDIFRDQPSHGLRALEATFERATAPPDHHTT